MVLDFYFVQKHYYQRQVGRHRPCHVCDWWLGAEPSLSLEWHWIEMDHTLKNLMREAVIKIILLCAFWVLLCNTVKEVWVLTYSYEMISQKRIEWCIFGHYFVSLMMNTHSNMGLQQLTTDTLLFLFLPIRLSLFQQNQWIMNIFAKQVLTFTCFLHVNRHPTNRMDATQITNWIATNHFEGRLNTSHHNKLLVIGHMIIIS